MAGLDEFQLAKIPLTLTQCYWQIWGDLKHNMFVGELQRTTGA